LKEFYIFTHQSFRRLLNTLTASIFINPMQFSTRYLVLGGQCVKRHCIRWCDTYTTRLCYIEVQWWTSIINSWRFQRIKFGSLSTQSPFGLTKTEDVI